MAVKIRKNGVWVPIGGDKGEKGIKGDKGDKGDKGEKGFKGDKSSDKGDKGDKGNKGDKGESIKGDKGPQGNDGNEIKGDKGDKGDKGLKGDVEEKGNKGDKGNQGEKGENKGEKGDKGQKGDVEEKGNKGDKGNQGEKGENKGEKGDKGLKGDVEQKGNKGVEGEKGSGGLDATGPIGQIVAWSGNIGANYSNIPDGYLLCNGDQIPNGVSNNVQGKSGDFSPLYSIVGAYIPNLKDKFIRGASDNPINVGQTGGSADAVLITHDHTQQGGKSNDDGGSFVPGADGGGPRGTFGNMTNINTTGIDASGNVYRSGHNLPAPPNVSGTNANLPPYYTLAYIIKFSAGGSIEKGQKGDAGSTSGITINTPGNQRLVTSTGFSNSLDCEEKLLYDSAGSKLTVSAGQNGYVHLSGSDGCIEIFRKANQTNLSGPFIDFKDDPLDDYDVRLFAHETDDMLVVAPKAAHTQSTFHVDGNQSVNGNLTATGSIIGSSKNFRIPHPLVGLSTTKDLIHSVVESPQYDNIYRGKIDLVDGVATINIDNKIGMTEGTFVALNRDIQCFTTNETGWTAVKGSVSGNILTITAQPGITTTGITTNTCTDTISWLVIGERQDPSIKESNLTDADGYLILEPDHISGPSFSF